MEDANGRVCKICDRWFANGKAMGGHMRSHMAKLPLPAPKPQPEPPPSPATLRSANSGLSSVAISDPTVLEDGESDTESRRAYVDPDKASLRPKRSRVSALDAAELVSSISSEAALSDVDVALCLLLLSVDNFSRGSAVKKAATAREAMGETGLVEKTGSDEEEGEERDESFCMKRERTQARAPFRCDVCKKLFGSYRSLGGHRASHSHGKIPKDTHGFDRQRIFKCSFCDKVFDSGQGLGGHKKVHLLNAAKKKKKSSTNCDVDAARKRVRAEGLFIDLISPAASKDHPDEGAIIWSQTSGFSD